MRKSPAYRFGFDYTTKRVEKWIPHVSHLRDKPCRILEIGTGEGRTTLWILDNVATHPESRVWTIDSGEVGGDERRRNRQHNLAAHPRRQQILAIEGRSAEVLPRIEAEWDMAYIDGDHRGRAILADSCLVLPAMRPGGVVIWDDYEYTGRETDPPEARPRLAIDAVLACWAGKLEVVHREYQVIARLRDGESPGKGASDA